MKERKVKEDFSISGFNRTGFTKAISRHHLLVYRCALGYDILEFLPIIYKFHDN